MHTFALFDLFSKKPAIDLNKNDLPKPARTHVVANTKWALERYVPLDF
jgi:hypothetical protein